jgi:uncharacterized membrane protein YhiD involved in acid resistance
MTQGLEQMAAEAVSVESTLRHALIALPLATLLGAALALRPRKRGAPKRSVSVIETQIILAVIGALVMIVVGSSLARAFGVVGAAGLVRYRAKIDDPKDAAVMLSTLAVGLACGIGVLDIAIFAAVFIIALLFAIEWFEPRQVKPFVLAIKAKEASKLQPKVEELLRRRRWKYEMRASAPDEFSYAVQLPEGASTDAMSSAIMALDKDPDTAVGWTPEKPPKA